MVKKRHAAAIELLLCYPDATVAETLGIKLKTLIRWMGVREFREALREREREQSRALSRVATQAALRAASTLGQQAGGNGEPCKLDSKILLEVVKISGAYEKDDQADSADALAEIINRMNAEPDA